ncbi:uncharacterized protein LOC127798387 isoform X2 [Diospyros lotus]|uniref:uncharacterized protein LOC127798387 isoform X2 n=1 Tax=Diospyros lotus TaxID=55363 RepID=UPI00224E2D70|nr:uncharacterized protein LOC127798387 isoform X2 [Diospyros lotus]
MADDMSSSSAIVSRRVGEFIRKEVADWDDVVMATARFKAFSGQRSDWEPRYTFWRDLILKVATHLGIFRLHPSQIRNIWFNRGGLAPLCLDRVLAKAAEVVKLISETQWTSSCIITMKKFQEICGGSEEASVILSYLSRSKKMQYLAINKSELLEGVKVSLSPEAVSRITSLDYDVLHLISTAEKLKLQLDVVNKRWEMSRKLALASLQSENRKIALKHARELKLASESREKCTALLNRVEEVLRILEDAESSKKVSEAIQIGAQAMKENRINVEEIHHCLQDLEESIESQRLVENALESTSLYTGVEDEEVEDELNKLELEVGSVSSTSEVAANGARRVEETEDQEIAGSMLNDALSNLSLVDDDSVDPTRSNLSKSVQLEAQ